MMNQPLPRRASSLPSPSVLQCAGCGFGAVALRAMLADVPPRPRVAGEPGAAIRPSRPPRDLSLHGRRTLAARPFVPKAGSCATTAAGSVRRAARRSPGWHGEVPHVGPAAAIKPRGQSGATISDLLPRLAGVATTFASCTQCRWIIRRTTWPRCNSIRASSPKCVLDGRLDQLWLGDGERQPASYISIHADSDVRPRGAAWLPAAHQATVVSGIPKDPKESAIRICGPRHDARRATSRGRFRAGHEPRLLGRVGQMHAMEGMIDSFELAFRMQAETPGSSICPRNPPRR